MAVAINHRTNARLRPLGSSVVLGALMLVIGCDSGPKVAPVHGNVTYKGKSVPTGTVTFYPSAGGRPAVGNIASDGSYTLSRNQPGDGAVVGEYKATIEAREAAPGVAASQARSLTDELAANPMPQGANAIKDLVPAKYSTIETSGLTATVRSENNQIDFDLP
jgi:hypothetical protein